MALWDDPVSNPKRRPSLRGAVMLDVSNGSPRVRRWPSKGRRGNTQAQQENRTWFRQAAWAMKYLAPDIQSQVAAARTGKPLLPRDLLMMMFSGRLGQFHLPNGTVWRPQVAITDISEMLDFITDVQGMMLYRGASQWEGMPAPQNGNEWWWLPPDPTSWISLSGDASAISWAYDPVKGTSANIGPRVTGSRTRCRMMPITAPLQPWSLEYRHQALIDPGNFRGVGVILRDTISGRLLSFTQRNNAEFSVDYWSGLTGYASGPFSGNFTSWLGPRFWKIGYDGTAFYWQISPDGVNWTQIWSGIATAYLSNRPQQIGFGGQYDTSVGIVSTMNVNRWLFTN